ncbi:MAG: hypothetical protein Q8Q25_02785 [bacterium]|nr:hypothetical protein [bacterium]
MKNLVKLLMLMAGFVSIAYASKVLFKQARTYQYNLFVDAYFSESIHKAIEQHLSTVYQSISIDAIGQHIKELFACVRKVEVFGLPNAVAQVSIMAHKPQYLVNGEDIVTHDGLLVSKDCFLTQVDSLYHLDITLTNKNQTSLSERCKHCVNCLTPQLLDDYRFVWEDDTHAWLYDKMQPNFALLFDAHTVPDVNTVYHCNTIKQELTERGVFERKSKKVWVADLRFTKQIIVFSRG